MTEKSGRIKGYCFDFDGVFYDYSSIAGCHDLYDRIMAHTAREVFGKELDFNSAKRIVQTGYRDHGDCISGLCEWAEKQGHNPSDYRLQLFRTYHTKLQAYLKRNYPNVFIERLDLQAAFELSAGIVANGLATHSCAQSLARPLLASMGINHYFNDAAVHGLDEAGFVQKHIDPLLVRMSFNSMGVDMQEGCFVEDTARNLEKLKEISPETRTVLIHNGRPLPRLPAHINEQYRDLLSMKKAHAIEARDQSLIIAYG